jgi:C1A family cysteine protease
LPLPRPKEGFLGGHCVVVSGYDFSRTRFPFDVFQIDNSWGPEWGNGGRFWMEAAWLNQSQLGLSSDFWVITKTT